jgi:Ca2+-binding EF-hand superfamily protein
MNPGEFDEEALKEMLPPNFEETARNAFNKADINKDGSIDVKELHTLMKDIAKEFSYQQEVTEEDAKNALTELDLNKNGLLEFNEFKKLFAGLYIIREMNKDS